MITTEERKEALALAIRHRVILGYKVESQSDFEAVLTYRPRIPYFLQVIMLVITLGLWYLVHLVWARPQRYALFVDQTGHVSEMKAQRV